MAVNIQLRRGTAAQWTAANPILALAEMAIEIDTDQFKVGNGIDHWNDLPYGGLQGPKGVPGVFAGLNLIGASTNINDRPNSATNGDAWGLITGTNLTISIWSTNTWYTAGPITSPPTYPIANTVFVATDGNDNASGDTAASAVLTLEKAVQIAESRHALTLIEVGPGTYTTQGHLDLPDDTIIRCVHRAAIIKPQAGYEERNVFRVSSGCFIEGFIFEGWRINDLDNPTEGFAISFRPGAVIKRAPYAHKVAVRSIPYWDQIAPPLDRTKGNPLVGRGGGVVLADGLICDEDSIFPNIMTWGATPVTPNGIGYCVKNGACINAVNAVSMWSHKHFYALSGGQIVLSACSTQFGDYTMVSSGYRNIINPYKSTSTLVAQPSAATTIAANTTTIINTMWSALTATGYTAGWTLGDEQLTKRDANTFLQVIRWVLESGNEKPALDFAKGLFNVVGTKVFSNDKLAAFTFSFNNMRDQINSYLNAAPAQYNTSTCKRDIGLILDSIGIDLLYGDESNSQFAGLQYWSHTGTTIPSYEFTATIASINYLRDLSLGFVDASLTATVTTLYSTITNILSSGTSPVSAWLNFGGLPSTSSTFTTSYATLQANKAGMQSAVIQFIGSTYPTLVYNSATCYRDVGYIIDSVSFDLLHMSNAQSIKSGVYYYGYSSTTTAITNEEGLTIAGYNYIKTLLPNIVRGFTVTNKLQTGTAQVITANTGTLLDSAVLNDRLTLINNIIANGQDVAGDLVPMSGSYTTNTATINAYNLLMANKNFIAEEVIVYVNGIGVAMVTELVKELNLTLTNTVFQKEPSLITAIGHTWSAVMAGVALTKIPPARNLAKIQDSILEINEGTVIASGQDDVGNAVFVGGLEVNADTGELTGPPFISSVNQIATRASITRSF